MRKLASARMDHSRTLKNQARCQTMNTVGAAHSSAAAYMYIHLYMYIMLHCTYIL